MFADNRLTGTIPNNLFAGCRKLVNTEYMFANNKLLSGNIPESLFLVNHMLKTYKKYFLVQYNRGKVILVYFQLIICYLRTCIQY